MKVQDNQASQAQLARAQAERAQSQKGGKKDAEGASSFANKLHASQRQDEPPGLKDASKPEDAAALGERLGQGLDPSQADGMAEPMAASLERLKDEDALAQDRAQSALHEGETRLQTRDEHELDAQQVAQHVDQQQVQEHHQVQAQTQEVAQSSAADRQAVVQLVDKLVRSCQVGHDHKARRVMLMEVEIPGRGQVHVRLQQSSQGMEVRFRARDEPTAQLLRAHQGQLEEGMRQRGVEVQRITITSG